MLHATLRLVMRLIVLIVVADVKLIPAETFEICGKKGAKRRSARDLILCCVNESTNSLEKANSPANFYESEIDILMHRDLANLLCLFHCFVYKIKGLVN